MAEGDKRYKDFDRATKYLLCSYNGHPTLSRIKSVIEHKEFPATQNANFIAERLIGHFDANQAILRSIPANDPLASNKLKKHIIELINKNKAADSLGAYPPAKDIAVLTLEETLMVYEGLLAHFINYFSQQKNLGIKYWFSQHDQPEALHTAEELMLYSLEAEAEFSGYLLKALDLHNLLRPVEVTNLYGDGKPSQSEVRKTNDMNYWLNKYLDLQEDVYPDDIKDLGGVITRKLTSNQVKYADTQERFYKLYVTKNRDRPSRLIDDLIHEVSNLILRNKVIDEVTKTTPEFDYPSSADLNDLGKDQLIKLYKEFGIRLMESFKKEDAFQNKNIKWYGKELTPREFLILTFDHLSLHAGSLSFMTDYFTIISNIN